MARRQWTLLVVSENELKVRQYHLTREVVRVSVAVALVAISALSSLATAYLMKQRMPGTTARLEKRNEVLKGELQDLKKQLTSLDAHIEELSRQDEAYRLLAGLEPINPDVRRVGIGGPGSDAGELAVLDPAAGQLAYSASAGMSELLRRARLLSFSWREASETLKKKQERLAATPSIVPTQGYLSSAFTRQRWHPVYNIARPHEGVDITAPRGTPIVAAAKGRVSRVGNFGDYGLLIEIDHGYGVATRYAHASKTLVRRGQLVQRGDTIGRVGDTGLAVGPHLHYEVLVHGRPTNPRNYFFNANAIAD